MNKKKINYSGKRHPYLACADCTCLSAKTIKAHALSPVFPEIGSYNEAIAQEGCHKHLQTHSQTHNQCEDWNLFKCVTMWVFKFALRLNLLWQMLHSYGFSPVWILMWRVSSDRARNFFPQTVQGQTLPGVSMATRVTVSGVEWL